MSLTTWYRSHFARDFIQPDYLANGMPPTNDNAQGGETGANANGKDKKSGEPLFGPSIGSVSSGPSWTLSSEKKIVTDELTPDIVNGWVEKSKEPSHPTTTLQALVNLKRPTLRLSPLASVPDEPSTTNASDQHHHGLEFEYDCDAPKCGIYVNVHLPKNHPDAPSTSSHSSLCKLQVFDMVVDGGFGNRLKLEDGALLELGRFEHPHAGDQLEAAAAAASENTTPPVATGDSSGELSSTPDGTTGRNNSNHHRRRFTQFHFRKRSQNRSIAGPALAVVDADPVPAQDASGKPAKDGKDDAAEEGVKVTIRLVALDEQGTELASPNEQVTYLHIVRFGQKSTTAEVGEDGVVEDARPWVVKVVKREATIGPHTFHLHEIYGLTSASSHNAPPTAEPPTTHTYPPDESQPAVAAAAGADDEEPQSECLLCLSSPREVVLLPCRHLVACKDCALNMVEFGAGGNITQASEATAGGDETAGPDPVAGAAGTPTTSALNPATNPRRKRKAKGWFCPVCRQPYTSMLRLTTSSPPASETKDGEGSGTEDEGPDGTTDGPATTEVRSGGLLGGAFRPGFLRGLSMRGAPAADVENQNANATRTAL